MSENIVKKVSQELNLTYEQLGEKIGYSKSALNNAARTKVSPQLKKAIELYLETISLKNQNKKFSDFKNTLKSFLKD